MKIVLLTPYPNIEGISVYLDVPDHVDDACLEDYVNEKLDAFCDADGYKCAYLSSSVPDTDIIDFLQKELKSNA